MKHSDDDDNNIFDVLALGQTIGRLQSNSRILFWLFSAAIGLFTAVIAPSLFFFFSHMMETNGRLSDIENKLSGAAIEKLGGVTSPNYDEVNVP